MSKVVDKVRALVEPIATANAMEIVDIVFNKQYGEDTLSISLDKEGGINLNDCEFFHNLINDELDKLDPTEGKPYNLNISSAGLDRPLKTNRDFDKHIGKKLELSLYKPLEGKKKHEGVLESYDDVSLTFSINGKKLKIDKKEIAVVKAVIEF